MLAFEREMFLDVMSSDGLLVVAKGLGVDQVFASLLSVYSDPGNLVLVMGVNEAEEEHFLRTLQSDDEVKLPPRKITSEYSAAERQKLYLGGGVLFVTTRILVVDLLTDRIPAHLVTGILVYRAHKTAESCQESFVLRLFRQKNDKGFIKAFSAAPVSFRSGFCQVSRVMRSLFLRHLYLWPRFHASVNDSLSNSTPEVIEMQIEMTKSMTIIQTAVLDLISFTLQELRRINPTLDSYEELTVENALARSFQKLLQRELDPVWHQLSSKSRQLVSDLKTLRSVMTHLTQYDCVTFHTFVSALRTTENAVRSGGWMLMDAAETLFLTAKERVFGEDKQKKKAKLDEGLQLLKELKFEGNPKWRALFSVVDEVKKEVEGLQTLISEKLLILTADDRTAVQLLELLELGEEAVMVRLYNKCLGEKHGRIPDDTSGLANREVATKGKELKHKGQGKKSKPITLTQMADDGKPNANESKLYQLDSPVVMVYSIQAGDFEISRLINEVKPRFVVMYDADVATVRILEVFQARNPEIKLKVYFLMFDKSVEEQAYLTTLRKEKEAFEHLMEEKATMVVPEERDRADNPDLVRGSEKASDAILGATNEVTRKGGGAVDPTMPRIIVDMREFRSELPSLIHKRGIEIEPVTIDVGDYILTPEICVERKSISDLIGSLQNGRLYNQATNMTRFYSKPMLLIEFDQNKPFAFQGRYYLSRDIASSDLTARLQLLTIHFPSLRILWSPSPHATAELFEELKKGREQPDPSKAASLNMDVVDEAEASRGARYNAVAKDFLSKLPGVTSRNVFALMNRAEDLKDLLEFGVDDLEEIMGSRENAVLLHKALHEKVSDKPDSAVGAETKGRRQAQSGRRFKTKTIAGSSAK